MIANVMMKAGHSRYEITSFSCFFSFSRSGNLGDSVLFIYRMDKLSSHRCAHCSFRSTIGDSKYGVHEQDHDIPKIERPST